MSVQEKEREQEEGLIDITEALSDYFRIFRRMWVWILLFIVVGAGIAYFRAMTGYTPMYRASATFTINIQSSTDETGTTTFYDNAAAEQMAKTFPYILTSDVLRRQVAKNMGTTGISGSIEAQVTENTNLLTISVTDQDAERAYTTLRAVVKNYPDISEVIIGKIYMEQLDETGIPASPINPPNFKRSAVKGGILGLLLVAIWTGILVVTRRTVRKEGDIQKRAHMKCLGTVPEVQIKKRSRKYQPRLLLTDEKYEKILQEPLRMLRNKVEYSAHEYKAKTFLITSALAGEGKSTVAVNLALSLAQAGRKVVLIDCDLRHPSDREILGMEQGDGLKEVLEQKAEIQKCLLSAKKIGLESDMNLIFLPGGEPIEDGSELLSSDRMRRILQIVEKWADYVILDSAPAGLLTDAVVLAQYADAALFVVRKDFARVNYIMDGLEHLAESRIQIVGGILNGV